MEPIALSRLFRAPKEITYVEHRAFGAVPMGHAAVRQHWKPLAADAHAPAGAAGVYDVEEFEVTPDGSRWREGWHVAVTDAGLVHLGAVPRAGVFEAWDPPQLVLPALAGLGPVASGIHRRGERVVERVVEIVPSDIPGGITVVSDTRGGPARIIMRDHYVPEYGWAGFEGLIVRPNGQLRVWSEDVSVDGVQAPKAPEQEEETDA